MYRLRVTDSYKKHRDALLKKDKLLAKRLRLCLDKLAKDPLHPSLKSHKVNTSAYGTRWSSRVTGDTRIIWDYDIKEHLLILLLNIGGHSGKYKVYK